MPRRVSRLGGTEGTYIDAEGKSLHRVGTWQLKYAIDYLEVESFQTGRERLAGSLELELSAPRRDSDHFTGQLRLRGGKQVLVNLTLLEGSMLVNHLGPEDSMGPQREHRIRVSDRRGYRVATDDLEAFIRARGTGPSDRLMPR